jgi:Rhamnogalacturonan I lyases beta-sheet domain
LIKLKKCLVILLTLLLTVAVPFSADAKKLPNRQMEFLDRGAVAVETEDGIFLSWRFLGNDKKKTSFHIYRDGKKITRKPVKDSTNYLDKEGTANSVYRLEATGNGADQDDIKVWQNNQLHIPLQKPADGKTPDGKSYTYNANDASVGDLDGDGEWEIILKWDPSNAQDNSRSGYTGNVFIDAYELDGTHKWRIDLGHNIRAGAHYTQMLVYDFDGNGKSELVVKTADGTTDAEGKVIGDQNADYRNSSGYILEGPEYLSVFEGNTGKMKETVNYEPARGDICDWGDCYGNRGDRFLAGVAYLDGKTPSIIEARGYYEKTTIAAYTYKDGKLTKEWLFDSDVAGNEAYAQQGNHNLSIADVDADGKDEIIYGSMALDDDGTGLYSTGLKHGDAMHVSDLDPSRPGLEVFQVHESSPNKAGIELHDARTGELLWGIPTNRDIGRGLAADIDPRYPGAEMWAVDGEWNSPTGGLYAASGEKISTNIPPANFAIWWDGDLSREILDHTFDESIQTGTGLIGKWNPKTEKVDTLLDAEGTFSNNGTKGTPALQADLIGDWREEAIWRTEDSSELVLYTTTDMTEQKLPTLMHDPVYRLGVAWQNVAYNQPPHTSYFLGNNMNQPDMPRIDVIKAK